MAPTLESIQNQLIEKFDTDYWNAKARIIYHMLNEKQTCKQILQRDEPKDREFLLTELNAVKIHCCETFIRHIMIRKFNLTPLIPLMALSQRIYQEQLKKMETNFETYFGGDSEKYFINNFFPVKRDEELLKKSAQFMKTTIKKILEELSKKSVYNNFKHGFYGSISIQDNAKMTVIDTGEERKIPHLLSSYDLKKENSKGGNDHVIFYTDHGIEVERDMRIISTTSKMLANYYEVLKLINKIKTSIQLTYFSNEDGEVDKIFSYDAAITKFEMKFPFKMPRKIKTEFNIRT